MNKLLIAMGIVAVGAGGYFYTQNQPQTVVEVPDTTLDYIPADSVAVGVQFKPLDLQHYIASAGSNPSVEDLMAMAESDPYNLTNREAFFYGLYERWIETSTDKTALNQAFGFGESFKTQFFTLGMLPVIKFELEAPQNFLKTLDELEAKHQFAHRSGKVGEQAYRAYPMVDSSGEVEAEVIFAQVGDKIIVAFNIEPLAELNQLDIALEVNQPASPLAATTTLADLQTKYPSATGTMAGYFDFEKIAKAVTTTDTNLLAKQITKLAEHGGEDLTTSELHSDVCKQEIQGIAANWPRLIWGMDSGKDDSFVSKIVLESNNQVVLSALQSLRGFVAANNSDSLLSMGLGLNVNNLAPALTNIISDLQQTQYQCPSLASSQAEMMQSNPAAMAGMAAGFVNGLKGIGLQIFDYEIDAEYGDGLSKLDASFSISADNPQMLIQSAAMMMPPLAQLQIPTDGTPVALPPALTGELLATAPIYVAQKTNHLVIYTGDKAEQSLTAQLDAPLESNGMFSMMLDYQKLMKPMITLMEQSGEEVPYELKTFAETPYKMDFSYDILPEGISLDMNYTFTSTEAAK
ncbi:hypothetical protein [Vibrio sp. SCSIO 43136]|uniref:hypothetical protein n=1 Tax=Vibrio sp. SCSIO 43136 TaxID=2819101 RepID=UPI0020752F25|nr:hypothetical protein [Vibrio sp. SCSIO 43136]USD64141.1 hypothetical protein J4N39_08425 [Vibrio sp. SCSIO 43136]